MMQKTAKGLRLHIGIYGRRNVGKSSLLNALVNQHVSIVSDTAGTTTDPVEKPMELQPLGPVQFIDTAGVDDEEGDIGRKRVEASFLCLERTDVALLVIDSDSWSTFEETLVAQFLSRKIPWILVINKIDTFKLSQNSVDALEKRAGAIVQTSTTTRVGLDDLRTALCRLAPSEFDTHVPLIGDLVSPGQSVVLVVPIDKEAPKGRLILPQVQTIRDLLDTDAYCTVCKEHELRAVLDNFKKPPRMVVTDSQAFLKIAADTPDSIPMTSFSILFSRYKGDLVSQVIDTLAIEQLKKGDKILLAESCTHHPITDDISRVKIPRWITHYTGLSLEFIHYQGHDFPTNLKEYALVIHCGACMNTRREMLSRIMHCKNASVPITNFGLTIAYTLGIFHRALQPFPAAYDAYLKHSATQKK